MNAPNEHPHAPSGPVLLLAATVLGALALLGVLPDALVGMVPVMLYHRVEQHGALENGTRRSIYDHVASHPGSCIASVAEQTDVSHSTASYHLEKLAESSLVVPLEDGNKMRYFTNGGAFTETERITLAILENPTTREVLATIAEADGTYRAEVSETLDIATPTVNWHLDRLRACGFLTEEPHGRNRILSVDGSSLTSLLDTLVEKLQETRYESEGLEELLQRLKA